MKNKPKIIVENDEMVESGIQRYISLVDYDKFVESNYTLGFLKPVIYIVKLWDDSTNEFIFQEMMGFIKVFCLKETN